MKKIMIGSVVVTFFLSGCNASLNNASDRDEKVNKVVEVLEEVTEVHNEGIFIELHKTRDKVHVKLRETYFTFSVLSDSDYAFFMSQIEEDGGRNVKRNDDRSISFDMSLEDYRNTVERKINSVKHDFKQIKEGVYDNSGIIDIAYNDDFTDVTYYIELDLYDEHDAFIAYSQAIKLLDYHEYLGIDVKQLNAVSRLVDLATGDVLEEFIFPDELDENIALDY